MAKNKLVELRKQLVVHRKEEIKIRHVGEVDLFYYSMNITGLEKPVGTRTHWGVQGIQCILGSENDRIQWTSKDNWGADYVETSNRDGQVSRRARYVASK